ncbi:uncharacterized protein LOC117646332 [Thrips palmi]|uniref:Uncharacterized protein LOC117646332 n=1 Tax=Thrips palmi TaxID=161013 RepID=A0A6P8Z0H0_THRPL|nr:uncharacterized protein LOC117646332 [Thrips palmi]
MGDDASVQARPRLSPAVPIGPGGGAPGTGSPFSATPPGTALVRKKSHHPDLRVDADAAGPAAGVAGLGHKMELIHLNRTCTSVNLASAAAAHGLSPRLRCSSHSNLTDEEKMHRVRHQVSFAQDVGLSSPPASAAFPCEDLPVDDSDQDDDHSSVHTDEQDEDAFLDGSRKFSPDGEVDYLAVRPSLASTQLNEVRGPN